MNNDIDNNNEEIKANDELASRYFEIWDNYPIQKFTREIENRWLTETVGVGQSVLLAGSGGGREIEALLNRTKKIVAMDISPEMLKIGIERFSDDVVKWRLGDVHCPPEDIVDFDHVISLGGVFAYLKDPIKAACALAGTLNNGGKMTICVMNSEHSTEQLKKSDLGEGRIRRSYSVNDLCELMDKAGLTVSTIRGFRFFIDNLPVDWNKSTPSDGKINEIMQIFIKLESELIERMDPRFGKFIWITAHK